MAIRRVCTKNLVQHAGGNRGQQLSENREEPGWRSVASGAALNHGCICRILVSISVSSYTELSNFPFSSRMHVPHALPLHRESGDEDVSCRHYVATYKKNILRRICLIRDISGLIMGRVCGK